MYLRYLYCKTRQKYWENKSFLQCSTAEITHFVFNQFWILQWLLLRFLQSQVERSLKFNSAKCNFIAKARLWNENTIWWCILHQRKLWDKFDIEVFSPNLLTYSPSDNQKEPSKPKPASKRTECESWIKPEPNPTEGINQYTFSS